MEKIFTKTLARWYKGFGKIDRLNIFPRKISCFSECKLQN